MSDRHRKQGREDQEKMEKKISQEIVQKKEQKRLEKERWEGWSNETSKGKAAINTEGRLSFGGELRRRMERERV